VRIRKSAFKVAHLAAGGTFFPFSPPLILLSSCEKGGSSFFYEITDTTIKCANFLVAFLTERHVNLFCIHLQPKGDG